LSEDGDIYFCLLLTCNLDRLFIETLKPIHNGTTTNEIFLNISKLKYMETSKASSNEPIEGESIL
jgi:hypothetical protein